MEAGFEWFGTGVACGAIAARLQCGVNGASWGQVRKSPFCFITCGGSGGRGKGAGGMVEGQGWDAGEFFGSGGRYVKNYSYLCTSEKRNNYIINQ